MRVVLRSANLLAVIGTAWMAFAVTLVRLAPSWVLSLSGNHGLVILVLSTELIFTTSLLFFFVCFHVYNIQVKRVIDPAYATLAALVGALWMFLVAVLHRFPSAWQWFAIRESGLFLTVLQTVFILPFLFFWILFYFRYNKGNYRFRLRVSTVIAIIGQIWFLLASAMRISPVFWHRLIDSGIRRFMIITEPLVAFSLLVFLVMLYQEPET
jgi:hypothetical protein